MNIVLLDDVSNHNHQLKMQLENICKEDHIHADFVLEATKFEEVLEYAASDPPLTVYFLDIRLEQEQTGLDICRQLRRDGVRDRFIYVSAYPHYAIDCLKVHAYDLLLKPVDLQALRDCVLSLWREIVADSRQSLEMHIGSRIICVPISEICYIESQGHNVALHTIHSVYTYSQSMSSLEDQLKPFGFLRIHRKYLVNKYHVQEWDTSTDVITVHDQPLPVARRKHTALKSGK